MSRPDSGAVEAAAYWLVTFLDDGGTLTPSGMYWPLEPPLAHHDWLATTLTDDVKEVISAVHTGGSVQELLRDAVRDRLAEASAVQVATRAAP